MDTITHTVLGACLGEIIAGKQLGKKAILWGALANNLPDVDVITSVWMNHADSLLAHRGFTHSMMFALLCSPLLAAVSKMFSKNKSVSFARWVLLFGSGLFIHIFIDAFTVYGTGWFEPFSHFRVSFNTLFIVDPFFTLPILISAIALMVMKKNSLLRKWLAKAGLMITSVYLVVAIGIKFYVNEKTTRSFSLHHISYVDFMTTPTPFNVFLWYIISRNNGDYNTGYYSVFDKSFPITFNPITRNDSLIAGIHDREDLNKIIRFTQGYYLFSSKHDTVSISDMRFGQIGGWYQNDGSYVFSYNLAKGADNSIVLQRGRLEGNTSEAFAKLLQRIKGK